MGELAEEDRRPSTRRVCRSKWRSFARFCQERDTEPLPASPEMEGNYLSKRAEEVSLSTIRQDVAAIRWMHERHGADDPTEHAGVSRILDGINQTSDTVPEKKQAVLTKHVRAMVGGPAPRRARIRGEDIGFNADGMEVHVSKSKTEPRTVDINFARSAEFCPVRTLREWTEAAGLDRETVAGHSLRRGHLTQGALNGAELNRPKKQAGHSDLRTTAGYVEDAKRMETNTSRDLVPCQR
jgi:hypothetical protein